MSTARQVLFIVLLVLFWWAGAALKLWDTHQFPGPSQILDSFQHLISEGTLIRSIGVSLRRVLIGYSLSVAIGIPLGILIARNKWVQDTIGLLISGMQALPSICWLPIALLWFGLNDKAIIFVVVMGSMVSICSAVRDGVKNLPPIYVRAAKTMGLTQFQMLYRVVLPASMPASLTGAKLGWSYAWRALMSGELLFVSVGLGHLLMMGRELGDLSQVLVVMAVIIAIGLATENWVFGIFERRMQQRWDLNRS